MNTKSRLALLTAAMLSTTAMAMPSLPSPWDQTLTRTETVKYKPSEVTTSEGAAALYSRLQEAAVRVCSDDGIGAIGGATALQACVADALRSAVQQVAIPMVSALHQQAGRMPVVAATR
jgi:UrcA family protein